MLKAKNATKMAILLLATGCLMVPLSAANPAFATPGGKELLRRCKAADIKSWMDLRADPCDNFYQFACGKWPHINSAQLFGDYMTDKFQDFSKGLQQKLYKLLAEPKTGEIIEDKLRDFFTACKATRTSAEVYKKSVHKICKEYGQFSYFKASRNESSSEVPTFNWWSTIAKISLVLGKSFILSVDVMEDLKGSNRTMVYIGPPDFPMTQTMAGSFVQKLQEASIVSFLEKAMDIPKEQGKQIAQNAMNFERAISKGATDMKTGKTLNDLLTLYNTSDLRKEYQDLFDFEVFLTLVLNTTSLPEQVYLYDREYLNSLGPVINATNPATIEDYILWLLLEEYMVDTQEHSLSQWCAEKTKKYFGKFSDHAIYMQYRSEEYENEIFALWKEIKAVFHENLQGDQYYWMSNGTRKHAIEKLEKMQLSINSYQNENFSEFFRTLAINDKDYVWNIYQVLVNTEAMRPNKLQEKLEDIEENQVMSFTPVYNSYDNSIKIPVALLQPYRLWHPQYPKAIQYATLGFLLAHEMVHGYDEDGRTHDADGKANEWWDEMSSYEFESRRRCFQAQYHNYSYGGKQLPQDMPQPENIADNAGVKIAYMAYKNWLAQQKKQRENVESSDTFANLPYNNHELFFIAYAQLWCEDVQSLFRSFLASSDVHAPAKYRVIGSLSNFHTFSWIFKCDMKPETPMNPSIKCELY